MGKTIEWIIDGIKDQWDTWFGGIYAFLEWMVTSVCDYFWGVVDYCLEMVWFFVYYLYDFFLGEEGLIWYPIYWAYESFDFVLSCFPDFELLLDQHGEQFSSAMIVIGKLNLFFPVSEFGTLFGIFWIFVLVFLVGKLILKIIPWIG